MSKGILAAAILWVAAGWGGTAEQSSLELRPESKLWLEGDSTLHSFSSVATILTVSVELADAGQKASEQPSLTQRIQGGEVRKVEVTVPVRGLKSGESGLEKNMRAALKGKDFPEITFHLLRYEASPSSVSAQELQIKAAGQLMIAGKERAIELEARGQVGAGNLRIQGQKDILMTDYGIKPPTFMGMLKTRDRVVVHYDLVLGRENAEKRRLQ